MMAMFSQHFEALQSTILEHEYDLRVTVDCGCGSKGPAIYRCKECFESAPLCVHCILNSHRHLPFHHIEKWNSMHFTRTGLDSLGQVIQLGHGMQQCPNAPSGSKGRATTIVHTNGIHDAHVKFCHCLNAASQPLQFMSSGLFPATMDKPETVFTFVAQKEFHVHTLASKKSAYDYFIALQKLTDNVFPDCTPVSAIFCEVSTRF